MIPISTKNTPDIQTFIWFCLAPRVFCCIFLLTDVEWLSSVKGLTSIYTPVIGQRKAHFEAYFSRERPEKLDHRGSA